MAPVRHRVLRVRVSQKEAEALEERASKAGVSVSEFVRRAALGDQVAEDGRVAEGLRRRGARVVVREEGQ